MENGQRYESLCVFFSFPPVLSGSFSLNCICRILAQFLHLVVVDDYDNDADDGDDDYEYGDDDPDKKDHNYDHEDDHEVDH